MGCVWLIDACFCQVTPWLHSATLSLERDFVFSPPVSTEWKVTAKLAPLDSYKPVKDVLNLMAACSYVLSQGKSCDVAKLHSHAHQLPDLTSVFKAFFFAEHGVMWFLQFDSDQYFKFLSFKF